ncbi:unnamed protein product [Eruca vesicaria subsp. sativa]|uniref:Secreted protein n=1 Tax=Eruca vesicaria subsp. sativa TaxID=29727 RepID=A0ABC8IMN1_ERUVS|nr:unnamed protein product [Eruca vesicaria subsp. sativa]
MVTCGLPVAAFSVGFAVVVTGSGSGGGGMVWLLSSVATRAVSVFGVEDGSLLSTAGVSSFSATGGSDTVSVTGPSTCSAVSVTAAVSGAADSDSAALTQDQLQIQAQTRSVVAQKMEPPQ